MDYFLIILLVKSSGTEGPKDCRKAMHKSPSSKLYKWAKMFPIKLLCKLRVRLKLLICLEISTEYLQSTLKIN